MSFQGFLRQSTAVDVKIGPFVDSGDGDAEETGLTIAQGDILLSKNGQTGAQKNDATSAAHAEDGMYNCEFDATDTDTVGRLTLGVHVAGALFVRHDWQVVEEAVYDRDFAASATGVDADWTNAGRLDTLLDAIPTTAMRGTDSAATAASLATLTNAFILTSATIETVTNQTNFIIPATADATDDDAYNGAIAVFIDGTDANQKSFRGIVNYTASTRSIEVDVAPDFTVTTSDVITILSSTAVGAIWDEVLTGSTHNVVNSSGRRLRQAQEAGGYTNGAVYIDTVSGSAGTTNFENGVDSNQVNSIADANTIATSVGLSLFRLAPNSSITFAATQDGQVFSGSLWTLALGGRQLNETHIVGAEVTGTCTGHVHMDHCHLGTSSFAEGEFSDCGFDNTITITAANSFIFVDCYHEEDGAPSALDFGSAVGGSEVHIHGWKGNLLVINMGASDILHFSSAEGTLTLDNTNDGGTANLSGTFGFTDNSATVTINNNGQVLQALPSALVSGRMDSSIGAVAAGAMTDAGMAADAFDNLLVRDVDQVEASAPIHSMITAILKAVSRVRDNAGTLEVYRTDGTTVHMSQTVTADATLDPVDELTAGV